MKERQFDEKERRQNKVCAKRDEENEIATERKNDRKGLKNEH